MAQSYSNIEVIVAGDCAPPETEHMISELGDPRVRFHNRSVRGPYPEDETVRWYMIGTPPFNDGLSLTRGRWIAALGDDDAVRPDHTETLIRAAQGHRYESCYGRHQVHYPSGEVLDVGVFPPEKGEFVLQTTIFHAGLRFFQMEPADYLYAEPNDWSLCRRMLTAGVRFGMVPEFLADKHESRYHSHADWAESAFPASSKGSEVGPRCAGFPSLTSAPTAPTSMVRSRLRWGESSPPIATCLARSWSGSRREFAAYCGTRHCVGVGSGLSAIELALLAAGVGPGDEVIVPAYTWIATWLAVTRGRGPSGAGRRRRATYNLDPAPGRGGGHAAHARRSCRSTCAGSRPTWTGSRRSPGRAACW